MKVTEGLLKIEVPELATGASGASGSEPKPLLGASHPHAPGVRITVVNKLPQMIFIYIYIEREREILYIIYLFYISLNIYIYIYINITQKNIN